MFYFTPTSVCIIRRHRVPFLPETSAAHSWAGRNRGLLWSTQARSSQQTTVQATGDWYHPGRGIFDRSAWSRRCLVDSLRRANVAHPWVLQPLFQGGAGIGTRLGRVCTYHVHFFRPTASTRKPFVNLWTKLLLPMPLLMVPEEKGPVRR